MKTVYPAAHGDGGHAIRHHPPAAPPLWAVYTTPQPDSLIRDLFCATREAVFHALTEPQIVEPTPAKITERLGEFVRRYTLDPAVIDVRRDPDDPTKLIVERRFEFPPQLETIP